MNLAILSCGPSLKAFLDAPVEHDRYMGVNRAVEAYPCDWWVALDPIAFTEIDPRTKRYQAGRGCPLIFTSDNVDARHPLPIGCLAVRDSQAFKQVRGLEALNATPWRQWSGVYALMVGACVLRAKRLTLYGYDMAGHQFWNGVPVYEPGCRLPMHSGTIDESRWQHERHAFESVVEWLIRRGVEVERVNDGKHA